MVNPVCRPGVTLTVHPIADPLLGLDQDLLQPAVQGIDGGLVKWDGPLRPPLSMLPWEAQMVRWKKRLAVAAVLLSVLALTGTLLATQSALAAGPRYLDRKAPVSARVKDLLRRMTLEEKVGQMDQIVLGKLRAPSPPADGDCNGGNNDPLQPVCLQKVLIDEHTGSILSGGTDNPTDNTGRGWAVQYNTIQRYAIEHSRLHIPIIYGVDAVHGFGHPFEATLFPQSIGMGATWDPALARAAGAATRRQLLATGGNWNFAPVQDLARDNRWGRYYETWAEAPMLAAAIGAANVRGLQGGGFDTPKVAATVKHFAGYSQSINGHDRVEAQLSVRDLQYTFLPSYAGGLDAGAATVMVNSGSVNGVPAHASHFLLTEELRGRLGFKGVVISDYGDVRALQTAYHIAADYPEAVAKAVNAGVDVAMEPSDPAGWNAALLQDVRSGAVSRARVNEAVTRILTLKFKLGLFDHPYVDPAKADAAVTANRDLARRAAGESITLLRNQDATLPLKTDLGKLVVTGPSAGCEAANPSADPACQAAIANQLGGWSVSWQGAFHERGLGAGQGRGGQPGAHGRHGGRGGGRATLRRGAGRQPAATAPRRPAGPDRGAGGDWQASDRGSDRWAPARAGPGGRCRRAADGLPARHRGRLGRGRRALRQGQPQWAPAGQLAVGGHPQPAAVAVQPGRAVAAGRPAQVLGPAARHQLRSGVGLQPALPVRLRPVLHDLQDQRAVGDRQRVAAGHRDRDLHHRQHRRPGGRRGGAGLRAPAGQSGGHRGAAQAAGGLCQGAAGRRPVQGRARRLPGIRAGGDRRRHRRRWPPGGAAGRLPGAGGGPVGGLLGHRLTPVGGAARPAPPPRPHHRQARPARPGSGDDGRPRR